MQFKARMKSAKPIKNLACLFLLPLLLTGCSWGDEYDTHQLTGRYYLSKIEPSLDEWDLYFDQETRGSGLGESLLKRPIVEVGFNEKCIILRVASASPQFYIALMTDAVDQVEAQANVRGPMTKHEFQNFKQEINGDTLLQFNPSLTKSGW
ncbi:hypothetical protein [Hymenobacter sp. PAMC 26628]|uniref:hypothetical protein n=1 Tax=Hymenobacter sp. PAMC 26628 TaxID=1484118 RepID=UPI00138F2F02|nr:hypothetical protein [Hymenobacter sp. PAMC 26628]